MAEVKWTVPAVAQLEQVLDYIALDKIEVAKRLAVSIVDQVGNLASFPLVGKPVPEIAHPDYRQLWIKPCWIYYRIDKDVVFILHIRRAERPLNLDDLFSG